MSDYDAADDAHLKHHLDPDTHCHAAAHPEPNQEAHDQQRPADEQPIGEWLAQWIANARPGEARRTGPELPRLKLLLPDNLLGRPLSSLTAKEIWAWIKESEPM